MRIKNKLVYVYDIEVFPNCFHCTIKKAGTNDYFKFEISERINQVNELIAFFTDIKDKFIVGYNNIHYDNPIINFIIERQFKNDKYLYICEEIYNLSQIIITSDTPLLWKKYKYATKFTTLDLLTMMFSQKLRVGLKEMQVTMQFHNVQEYTGDFSKPIKKEDIDEMIAYNINDVDSTEELLFRNIEPIKLRLGIEKEYGTNVLNNDGMTIGMEILKIEYLKRTGKTWNEIKDLKTPCDTIDLEKVILPFIEYKTPILQQLLTKLKNCHNVDPGRKGVEEHFLLGDVEVVVSIGGIHTKNKPEIIIPNKNQILLDSDVASLYPSLLINYGFSPPHLGKEFLEIYSNIRTERLIAKKNKQKIKNETYKLALNGLTGNLQNEYSWVYSPFSVVQIRINGQLLLLMLVEKLIETGAIIKQLNTDGVLYLFDKNKKEELNNIIKEWETQTKLTMETDEFEAFYQYAINDYIGICKGYSETKDPSLIKQKGLFIDKVSLGKGMQAMIIPHALNKYFCDGIPIENTIKSCDDINMFITYQKVSKEFNIEYNNKLITRINRYYASTNGSFLYKCKIAINDFTEQWCRFEYIDGSTEECSVTEFNTNPKYTKNSNIKRILYKFTKTIPKETRYNYVNLLCDSGVTICNNLDEIKEFPKNINYRYYIKECNKIISALQLKQLTLF